MSGTFISSIPLRVIHPSLEEGSIRAGVGEGHLVGTVGHPGDGGNLYNIWAPTRQKWILIVESWAVNRVRGSVRAESGRGWRLRGNE